MPDAENKRRLCHIHLDILGGIAGDMFIAAFLDARPDLATGTIDAIRSAGLPAHWLVEPVKAGDGGLVGTRMKIEPGEREIAEHGHYQYRDIVKSLTAAPLAGPVRARALEILRLIAEAEAKVHGIPLDDVVLHEVGALDSIADVVGAAFLIENNSPLSWSMSPLPLGGGFVQAAHGRLPVPAPATQILLEGFPFVDDGVTGERITPTGAAILRHLHPDLKMPDGIWDSLETGHGFGTRSLPGIANMLRVRFYEPHHAPEADAQVAVIEFMVDDQTPEDLAAGLDALRKRRGVLDVLAIAAAGKKGRLGQLVQILTEPGALDETTQACFVETTTIGLRWRFESRVVLSRQDETSPEGLSVKVVGRPEGVLSRKAAMDDILARAHGQQDREQLRRRSEAAVAMEKDDG